ncbi:septum formation initiator family protein [Caloramator mitchellensis]|nr:septum formation initiator family protein [Caloramator mitchellensis]
MANNKNYVQGTAAYKLPNKVEISENKLLKQNKVRRPKPKEKKFLSIVIAVSILSIFTLARYANILKLNAEIRSIKKEIKMLQDENENINVQIAGLNKIREVDKLAVEKYGMIIPHPSDVKYVDVKPLDLEANDEKEEKVGLGYLFKLLGLIY